MEKYISDRRTADRRQGDRRQDSSSEGRPEHAERRQGERRSRDRRQGQRRQAPRLVYPVAAAPKVLNTDFHVVNLSSHGIMLARPGKLGESHDPIALGSATKLKIQFHDQQVIDVEVKILRCQYDPDSQEQVYAGTVDKGMSPERMSKEQVYLERSFPES